MSKTRLIITSVVIEGRTHADVAREYGVSPSWVSRIITRYRTEGEAAFHPKSRRPNTSPRQTAPSTRDIIIELRRTLNHQGLDAGPATIAWHLTHHHQITISRATIYRILTSAGLITREPNRTYQPTGAKRGGPSRPYGPRKKTPPNKQ